MLTLTGVSDCNFLAERCAITIKALQHNTFVHVHVTDGLPGDGKSPIIQTYNTIFPSVADVNNFTIG